MCFLGWALHIVDVLWTARRMNEGYVMPICFSRSNTAHFRK